jgi:hypothetical protein
LLDFLNKALNEGVGRGDEIIIWRQGKVLAMRAAVMA